MIESPLIVSDDGASHTQSVERMIQKITKASDIVFSAERREQYVRAAERATELRGAGVTKEDFGKFLGLCMFVSSFQLQQDCFTLETR